MSVTTWVWRTKGGDHGTQVGRLPEGVSLPVLLMTSFGDVPMSIRAMKARASPSVVRSKMTVSVQAPVATNGIRATSRDLHTARMWGNGAAGTLGSRPSANGRSTATVMTLRGACEGACSVATNKDDEHSID